MTLTVFCEDYDYEYCVIAYSTSNAIVDGKLSKYTKCKKQNRIGYAQMEASDA